MANVKVAPVAVLERRLIPHNNEPVVQWLVQWLNLPENVARWEDADFTRRVFPSFVPWWQGIEEGGDCQELALAAFKIGSVPASTAHMESYEDLMVTWWLHKQTRCARKLQCRSPDLHPTATVWLFWLPRALLPICSFCQSYLLSSAVIPVFNWTMAIYNLVMSWSFIFLSIQTLAVIEYL